MSNAIASLHLKIVKMSRHGLPRTNILLLIT